MSTRWFGVGHLSEPAGGLFTLSGLTGFYPPDGWAGSRSGQTEDGVSRLETQDLTGFYPPDGWTGNQSGQLEEGVSRLVKSKT